MSRHLDELFPVGGAPLGGADWDVSVLHYLGLDHIGHTHGPSSDLAIHKLKQLDEVVWKLHTGLEQLVSLAFSCG